MIARSKEETPRLPHSGSQQELRSERQLAALEDERKLRQIRDSWAASGYRILEGVELDLDNGRLSLRGSVPSFYLKQLAQHTALNVPGVQEIDNQLHVEPAHGE